MYETRRTYLNTLHLSQSPDGGSDSGSSGGVKHVSSTGHTLATRLAGPDTDGLSLDRVLTTERACVLGVLGDLDLLDDLTKRSTVTSTVFTDDSDFLSSFSHCVLCVK